MSQRQGWYHLIGHKISHKINVVFEKYQNLTCVPLHKNSP